MPVILVAAVLAAAPLHAAPTDCGKTFTGPMIKRAVDATYRGTRDVSPLATRRLRRYMRCARPRVNRARMRRYLTNAVNAWKLRRDPPMVTQLASWYEDGGSTACGYHAGYGVANKWLACGTKVMFRYHGRSVTATVDDRGPYVSGRVWDLNQTTAGALGFGGVDWVEASVSG